MPGHRYLWVGIAFVLLGAAGLTLRMRYSSKTAPTNAYVGSASCRSCHEKFYQLWSTSHHGRALQRYSPELAHTAALTGSPTIHIGNTSYRAEVSGEGGWIVEQTPAGERRYPLEFALGGKDVFYFLTTLDRGRYQVLPLAFDVREAKWMDATLSMTMHENLSRARPVDWHDPALTFNTSCYGCHVSQIDTNYDPATDSYHTTWREAGINCETCHGPAGEHVRLYQAAEKRGRTPDELGLISFKTLTPTQRNDACAVCHAKATAISSDFRVGDKFLDHFSLAAFENPDFYPDGRDLGENYTYTSWMLSPCVKSGQLDCIHCHTSSGRYRFAKGDPNRACLPCHEERVKKATTHSHHQADSLGNRCISCHMPMTEYARMRRSDHSMRPPAPAATIAYKSPNACNLCHKDRDARWADTLVRKWHADDYQAPLLAQAALIDAARKHDWSKLPQMLTYINDVKHDPIFTSSLIRLLQPCPDTRKFEAMPSALKDSSAMVRAAAADILAEHLDVPTANLLASVAKDEVRLARIRSAAALSRVPPDQFGEDTRAAVRSAMQEYLASLTIRLDDFAQHMNLGNYYAGRKELNNAIAEYERAAALRPGFAPPLVNASVVYSQLEELPKAEEALRRAIAAEPEDAAAHFNLGLLLAEMGKEDEAQKELRKSLTLDGTNPAAAYNLAVLVGKKNPAEALALCRKALHLNPGNPKYESAIEYYQSHTR